jgi:polyhydroxyalkanoate synthesis regulator phasin
MSSLKWVLGGVAGLALAGAIGLAALGGGAVAQADGTTRPPSAYETALAQQLGISVDQLQAAQKAALDSVVDQQVQAGNLTAEQGARIKAAGPGELRSGLARRAIGHMKATAGHLLDSAAKAIGISKDEVKTGLQNGQSLAQIAAAHNVSADQLKNGITVDVNARLEDAVKAGKLTQPQADKIMSGLNSHLDKLINRTRGPKTHQ